MHKVMNVNMFFIGNIMTRLPSTMKLVMLMCLIVMVCWNYNEGAQALTIPSIPGTPKLGVWRTDAHATFYGGNDASGTMGKEAF